MLQWENFSNKKKIPPFFFFLEGSWVQGLLAFLCGVCRFSLCLGSLQVLQLSLSVPGHAFEGKGGFGNSNCPWGWMCVCVCEYSSIHIQQRAHQGWAPTGPGPHHSHNPERGKRWMNTHPYIQICVFVWVVYGWLFRGLMLKRKKRMNKFDSISASCVMALWFTKLSW